MIAVRKAQLDDLEKITYALIMCNKEDISLTTEEVKEYLDHTYYLYDTDNNIIISVICAYRISDPNNFGSINEIQINTKRYEIKYFIANDITTKEDLYLLVRELLADMNDLLTVYRSEEIEDNRLSALRENNFKYNSVLKCYIRIPTATVNFNAIR